MSEMETTMKDFCEDCIVRNKVMGTHGIEDRLERIEEEQKQLGIKIARLEWLVPIVTAALVALINWIPKIVATTAAAVR